MANLSRSECCNYEFFSFPGFFPSVHVDVRRDGFSMSLLMTPADARSVAQEILLHADVAEGKEGAREALAAAHAPVIEPAEKPTPTMPYGEWRDEVEKLFGGKKQDNSRLATLYAEGKTPDEAFDDIMPF